MEVTLLCDLTVTMMFGSIPRGRLRSSLTDKSLLLGSMGMILVDSLRENNPSTARSPLRC